MSRKVKPDMRGLSEKGKKDYPKFTREQIEMKECEICTGYHTVKKYQIIKRSGNTAEIYLCDVCSKVAPPEGVQLICLEEPPKTEEEEEEFIPEVDDKQGDTLLV